MNFLSNKQELEPEMLTLVDVHYQYILKVIVSCRSYDQTRTCRLWLNRMSIRLIRAHCYSDLVRELRRIESPIKAKMFKDMKYETNKE